MPKANGFSRSLRVVILAGLVVLLSACGSTSNKSPKLKLNAADQTWAKKITLHLSDCPRGWRWEKSAQKIARLNCGPSFASLTLTGRAKSRPLLTPSRFDGQWGIGSEVAVFETKAQAITAFELSTSKQAYACIAKRITRTFANHGLRLGPANVPNGADDFPEMGDHSQRYTFWFSIYRPKQKDTSQGTIYDVTFIQRGRAIVELSNVLHRPGDVPWHGLEGLARTVTERMAENMAPAGAG